MKMNVYTFLLICCGVFLIKTEGIIGLKRIKRTDLEVNHIPKASDDFASVKSRSSHRESHDNTRKGSADHSDKHSKELDHMFDQVMENFNATKDRARAKDKAKGHKVASAKDKKQRLDGAGSAATYVLQEQEHAANGISHFSTPEKTINEVIMIDNTPKEEANVLEGVGQINSRDNAESGDIHNDMGHALLSDRGAVSVDHSVLSPDHNAVNANHGAVSSAHVIIPQNKMAISRPNAPFEQMFRLANMFFYNLARDTVPIHTQSASLTLMPVNSMAQTEFMAEEPDAFDYYYNTLESPSFGRHPTMLVSPSPAAPSIPGSDQSRTVLYGPPLVFKQPLSVNEPKNVLNVIENAIDTLMAGAAHNGDSEDEIELHCPIHQEKKSALTSDHADKSDDNGVIHVCSCRLIKKKKNTKKHADMHHGDTKSLLRATFI